MFPDFLPNRKGLGVLHSIIGFIPDEYKWMAKLIGMKGDLKQGVSELMSILTETKQQPEFSYMKDETIYLLSIIELNFLRDEEKMKALKDSISKEDNSNPLVVFSKALISMRTGNNDEAINVLEKRPLGKEYYPFTYLEYQLGMAYLDKLSPKANIHFENFLKDFKGVNFIIAANNKLAWSALVAGDISKYHQYNKMVL